MIKTEVNRFNKLYQRHLRLLKFQGKSHGKRGLSCQFPAALNEYGLSIPNNVPKQWGIDCTNAGKGMTALKYLSRYLYRGVISEKKYRFKPKWSGNFQMY